MLTNETVLKVFTDYLQADPDVETVLTSRGYTVLTWDNGQKDWSSAVACVTPEALLDELLDCCTSYLQLKAGRGERDLTAGERRDIEAECDRLRRLCEDLSK